MAAIGLKNIYVGIKNTDGSVVTGDAGLSATGVFAIDTNVNNMNLGSKTANITGLSGTITKIMGNNTPVAVSHAKGAPSVAIDSNYINPVVKNKMLGRVQNGDGGWVDTDNQVETGLIVESQSPITYKSVYFAFGRGIMTETGQNVQSNTDTAESREDDNLTYTALNYGKFNDQPYSYYDGNDSKFDVQKMFDTVFPGNAYDAVNDKPKASGSTVQAPGRN